MSFAAGFGLVQNMPWDGQKTWCQSQLAQRLANACPPVGQRACVCAACRAFQGFIWVMDVLTTAWACPRGWNQPKAALNTIYYDLYSVRSAVENISPGPANKEM